MREIKFRAWDEDNKVMLEPQDLTVNFSYWKWLGHKDVPLMQFTELLDKNGKEIYEGDIVKTSMATGPIYYDEKYGVWCAKWKQSHLNDFLFTWKNPSPEVIGNIHENPELLKV